MHIITEHSNNAYDHLSVCLKIVKDETYYAENAKILQEKLQDKEREVKIIHESYNKTIESVQKAKLEDTNKLQGIVNEQSELIISLERMMKEKTDEISSLTTKNSSLSIKLKECQENLSAIQKEITETLSKEEEKRGNLIKKISELEIESKIKEVKEIFEHSLF